jgi:two-component system sensor histidine kinase PrrB
VTLNDRLYRLLRLPMPVLSLRTIVMVAALSVIAVVITIGTWVWIGVTNDQYSQLDRRLDSLSSLGDVSALLGSAPHTDTDQPAPDRNLVRTVRVGDTTASMASDIVLPALPAGYADTTINGVPYRVRTITAGPATVALGAPLADAQHRIDELHLRVLLICGSVIVGTFLVGAVMWLIMINPFRRLAQQARDFASVASHELRTPLTAMRTNLEVLSTLELPAEQRKEVIDDIMHTQSRIEATLTALERLAQGELSTADDHVPVDITELLDRAAHDAMRLYPDLNVSLVPSPTVRLVIDNAIANAVKHGQATQVQLAAISSRVGVEITIDDNGTGVPEKERAAVFERFTRGSTASRSGSGLGLALVAQQAELHGGTASLTASPLGGARLLLRLPGPRPHREERPV